MCCCVRIGGVAPSGRSSSASSSAARYRSTQVRSSAASASSAPGASSRVEDRRAQVLGLLAVWKATNSARVIVVAAATTWKRNGMNGITQSSGTASFSLYMPDEVDLVAVAAPRPGCKLFGLLLDRLPPRRRARPARPRAARRARGSSVAIFVAERLEGPVVQLPQARVGGDVEGEAREAVGRLVEQEAARSVQLAVGVGDRLQRRPTARPRWPSPPRPRARRARW